MMTFYINRGRSDRFAQTWPDATVRWKRRQRIAIVAAAGQRESGGGQWWIDAAVKSQRAGRAETNFGYKFHVHLFGRTIAWRSDHSLRTRRPSPLPRLWHTYEFGLIAFGKKKKRQKVRPRRRRFLGTFVLFFPPRRLFSGVSDTQCEEGRWKRRVNRVPPWEVERFPISIEHHKRVMHLFVSIPTSIQVLTI